VSPAAITGVSFLQSIIEPECLILADAFGLVVVFIGSIGLVDLIFVEAFEMVVVRIHFELSFRKKNEGLSSQKYRGRGGVPGLTAL